MDHWQNKGVVHEPAGNKDSARENAPNFCRVPWKNITEFYNTSPIFYTVTAGKITITITYQGTPCKFKSSGGPYLDLRSGRTIHFGLSMHFNSILIEYSIKSLCIIFLL